MRLSLNAILKKQDEEALFPTYIANKGEDIVESSDTEIRNIGIHTFVLEKLMELYASDPRVQEAFQKGLNCLLENSVEFDNIPLWRWLKTPSRGDYLYPPDYDDIARARVVIELAESNGYKLDSKFVEFPFEELLEDGLSQQGGVYIFMVDEKRTSDRIDPLVNANVLYSLVIHLQQRNLPIQRSKAVQNIVDYLSNIINSKEYSREFEEISRCYLSHNLFGYVISETQKKQPIFDPKILRRVKQRVEEQRAQYPNSLEASLATLTLLNLDGNGDLIQEGHSQINESMDHSYLWKPEPFYQHRRLGNIFGSSSCTSIFCLEALEKARQE